MPALDNYNANSMGNIVEKVKATRITLVPMHGQAKKFDLFLILGNRIFEFAQPSYLPGETRSVDFINENFFLLEYA